MIGLCVCVCYSKDLVLIIVQKPSELFLNLYLVASVPFLLSVPVMVSKCLLQQCHKAQKT